MAKRYARLNWQNKPSVATPINATNLNKMDKGIDDCDNAIEEIYAKRVNNVVTTNTDTFLAGPVGKLLQDQITTINNNFAEGTFSPKINNTGVVHSVQDGYYIKTGKLITIFAKIETTSKSTEPSSNVITIGGFPFPPSAKSVGRTLFNIKVANATTAMSATVGHFASPSIFTISTLGNNSTNLYNAIKVSDTTDTTHIWISGQYFVD